jgi:Flp pilus assembly protein TadD
LPEAAVNPIAPPAQAEVTYDDALKMAMGLHRDGRWDGAQTLYRRLLELQPDDPNVMHFLGMLLHQRGQREEALPLLQRSVAIDRCSKPAGDRRRQTPTSAVPTSTRATSTC